MTLQSLTNLDFEQRIRIGQILDAAADYIVEHGWWDGKGGYPERGGPACAVIAVTRACVSSGEDLWIDDAVDLVRAHCGGVEDLAEWNDKQDHYLPVVTALRMTAYRLKMGWLP